MHPKLLLSVLSLLLVWGSGAMVTAADWPEFRGPRADGIVRGLNVPTEWSRSKNVVWRSELPGNGWSSPIVVGETVYLTTAIPQGAESGEAAYTLALLLIDVNSGDVVRQVDLFGQSNDAPRIHKKNSHASPTPVFDGQRIFIHFGHQGTACTELNGDVVWRNDALSYPPVHGNGGSPAIVGDKLIFSRDGADVAEVVALDKATGEVAWRTPRDVEADRQFSFATPSVFTISGRPQVILPGSNVVQSLDPETGEEIWRVRYEGYSVIPRPIVEAGLVFVCTGYNRPSLLAINPTGKGDVTESHLVWKSRSSIPHTPSLIGFDGKIAMVSDNGIAICFDARTGDELWKERIGGNFSASPWLVGDNLYLLSEEGDCTVLNVSGKPQEVSRNSMGERTLASPAVLSDGDLLLRTAEALYRIGQR